MAEFTLPKGERVAAIEKLYRFLKLLSAGKAWRITIEWDRATRSAQQCRYLNGVAYKLLSEATGYERDDISEYCCGTYWGWRDKRVPKTPRNPDGIQSVPLRTTTTNDLGKRDVLTWDAFADYVAFVQRFGAAKGVHIPDPDPNWRDSEEEE